MQTNTGDIKFVNFETFTNISENHANNNIIVDASYATLIVFGHACTQIPKVTNRSS